MRSTSKELRKKILSGRGVRIEISNPQEPEKVVVRSHPRYGHVAERTSYLVASLKKSLVGSGFRVLHGGEGQIIINMPSRRFTVGSKDQADDKFLKSVLPLFLEAANKQPLKAITPNPDLTKIQQGLKALNTARKARGRQR